MQVGGYVQYNSAVQNPQAPGPDAAEQTIGIVRSLFTAQGTQYAQVVWNPGSANPETALYTCDQLCPISQQQAMDLINQMNCGDMPPSTSVGSSYTQPSIPTLALPPALQNDTDVTPTQTGPITGPLSPGTGFQ